MLTVRKSQDRGYADHGWLKSYHSFSFAGYYDAQFMGWGNLRVINEDRIAPGTGFGTHGHRDMEILSYVLQGALAHQDSMGHVESIPAGDVQRMSAGRGVRHSEFNHAPDQQTHFLQIWVEPAQTGIEPSYAQSRLSDSDKQGRLALVASPHAHEQPVVLWHADAKLYSTVLTGEDAVALDLDARRKAYVHVVRGQVVVNGQALHGGDAAMLAHESHLQLQHGQDAEVLVFDLAP